MRIESTEHPKPQLGMSRLNSDKAFLPGGIAAQNKQFPAAHVSKRRAPLYCGRWRTVLAFGLTTLSMLGIGTSNYAQNVPAVVKAKMVLATDAVHPGSTTQSAVIAQITPGYHINDHHPTLNYLIPTELKFSSDKTFGVEGISYPKGKLQKFSFAENGLSVYEGRLVIPTRLRIAPRALPGDYTLTGQVSYQACNANACFPPTSTAFSLPVRVVSQKVPLKASNSQIFGTRGLE